MFSRWKRSSRNKLAFTPFTKIGVWWRRLRERGGQTLGRSKRFVLAILEKPEKFGLGRMRERVDFVQKQAAAFSFSQEACSAHDASV